MGWFESNKDKLVNLRIFEEAAHSRHPYIYNRICKTFLDMSEYFPGRTNVSVKEIIFEFLPNYGVHKSTDATSKMAYEIITGLIRSVMREEERRKRYSELLGHDPYKEYDWRYTDKKSMYQWGQ